MIDDPETPDLWPERFAILAEQSFDHALMCYYQQGCPNPDMPLRDVRFIALDFETTGLDVAVDEIISIGAVPFDLNRIYIKDARYWLLNPRKELSEASVVIHHLTHSEIDDAPDLSQQLAPLLETLAGRLPVVHYRYIERGFLDAALKRRIGEGIGFPVVDTMELEARFHRYGTRSRLKTLLGGKPASIRLADSRTRYNLPRYGNHHSLTDAIATAELLQAQIAHRFTPDTPIRELWV